LYRSALLFLKNVWELMFDDYRWGWWGVKSKVIKILVLKNSSVGEKSEPTVES
jgi:hypothetical protein